MYIIIIINKCDVRLNGIVRCLSFQLAERNGLSNLFNKENEKAGKDWLYHFMKRHNELTLRQPEATSAARVRVLNPVNVKEFVDLLEPLIDTNFLQTISTTLTKLAFQQYKAGQQKSLLKWGCDRLEA